MEPIVNVIAKSVEDGISKDCSDDIEKKIITAAEAYYLSDPIMSDEEFDVLVEALRVWNPKHPLLTKVGWGLTVYGDKAKLPEPIRHSLDKVQSYETLTRDYYIASLKLDGMSCLLQYVDGELKLAVTRGDGEYGVNITAKTPYIKGIPQKLEYKSNICLRGEIFISLPEFTANLAEDYVSPRASASGIINRKSFEGLEHVEFALHPECFLPYIQSCADSLGDAHKEMKVLPSDFKHMSEPLLTAPYEESLVEFYKKNTYYPTDGLVLSQYAHEDIFAFKFETEKVITKVIDVEWNVKKGGKLIPIIHYQPVKLYDTICKKCTGHNFEYIVTNEIGVGTEIELTKANEIIPYITKVVKGTEAITPEAGTFYCKGAHAYVNDDIQLELSLKHFVEWHFCFDGFKRPEIIVEALAIDTFKELAVWRNPIRHSLIVQRLEELGIKKLAPKIADRITEGDLNEKDFFRQFGFDGLGRKAATVLQPYIDEYMDCLYRGDNYIVGDHVDNLYIEERDLDIEIIICEPTGVNITVRNILMDPRFQAIACDARKLFDWEYKDTAPVVAEGDVKGKFIITGSLPSGRTKQAFADFVAQYGWKPVTTVNQADVVIGSPTSTTSKAKMAIQKGKPLLSEDMFFERESING